MARNVKSKLTLKDKIIGYIVNKKYGFQIFLCDLKKKKKAVFLDSHCGQKMQFLSYLTEVPTNSGGTIAIRHHPDYDTGAQVSGSSHVNPQEKWLLHKWQQGDRGVDRIQNLD